MNTHILPGHTNIKVHLIYDYKQDVGYKSRMVASGNMTGPNIYTYYYSVVSLCSMCIVVFLSELNNNKIRTGDIINAYLTARTYKKKSSTLGLSVLLLYIQATFFWLRPPYMASKVRVWGSTHAYQTL